MRMIWPASIETFALKNKASIGLFAKYPQPGQVKTRLIPLLGAERASHFAEYLILSTLTRLLEDQNDHTIWFWRSGGTDATWRSLLAKLKRRQVAEVEQRWQPDEHLGARMRLAMTQQLQTSTYAMLVGTDAIEMTPTSCHELIDGLGSHPLGFVPAHDGGYVAIAASQVVGEVFDKQIAWGTHTVLAQSLQAAQHAGVTTFCLPAQLDIDEPDDYQKAIDLGLIPDHWHTCFR